MFHTKVVEKNKTHFVFNNFIPESRVVYKIMGKNMVEPDRPHMTLWRMRFAFLVSKASVTHWNR